VGYGSTQHWLFRSIEGFRRSSKADSTRVSNRRHQQTVTRTM
jgi:hypothetical protein